VHTSLFLSAGAIEVRTRLKRYPRFHMHSAPTSASWLNLVERWFRKITEKCTRCGIFKSVRELKDAIDAYIKARNRCPKRFTWTARAEAIAGDGQFNQPAGVAVSSSGDVYVTDFANHRIQKLAPDSQPVPLARLPIGLTLLAAGLWLVLARVPCAPSHAVPRN
jgi:hypothetical protein